MNWDPLLPPCLPEDFHDYSFKTITILKINGGPGLSCYCLNLK